MTRNQKIALGCGGAGCLGLIVVIVAGCLVWFFWRAPRSYTARSYNYNFNVNSNANLNSDANENENSAASSTGSTSMSDDDKHKLYYAANMTADGEVVRRVSVKLGLTNDDFTPGANYEKFVQEHIGWILRNSDFIQTINTPEKARAYVNEHFPE